MWVRHPLWKSWVMSQKKHQLRQVLMWLNSWENSREGTDVQEKGKNSSYCLVSWPSRPCRYISLLWLGNKTSCNIATHSQCLSIDSCSRGCEERLRFRPFSLVCCWLYPLFVSSHCLLCMCFCLCGQVHSFYNDSSCICLLKLDYLYYSRWGHFFFLRSGTEFNLQHSINPNHNGLITQTFEL